MSISKSLITVIACTLAGPALAGRYVLDDFVETPQSLSVSTLAGNDEDFAFHSLVGPLQAQRITQADQFNPPADGTPATLITDADPASSVSGLALNSNLGGGLWATVTYNQFNNGPVDLSMLPDGSPTKYFEVGFDLIPANNTFGLSTPLKITPLAGPNIFATGTLVNRGPFDQDAYDAAFRIDLEPFLAELGTVQSFAFELAALPGQTVTIGEIALVSSAVPAPGATAALTIVAALILRRRRRAA